MRKGRTYGTLLIDLDRHCPVDLLPDRTADTLATWLALHPGAYLITRERAGAYAEGARQGAPAATQVADRWHILANLRDALERLLTRHQAALTAAAVETLPSRAPSDPSAATAEHPLAPSSLEPTASVTDAAALAATTGRHETPMVAPALTPAEQETTWEGTAGAPPPPPGAPGAVAVLPAQRQRPRAVALQQARRARRLGRHEAVVAQHAQGRSLRAIAADLHLSRTTVLRYVRASQAGGFPERQPRPPRPTPLRRFDGYLRARWAEGCRGPPG
jgi:transposase